MNLTKLAVKRPVACVMLILALAVFGLTSVLGFKMELIPEMEMPMLIVYTAYRGADPDSVDELVTQVIEDAGSTISGVDNCYSESSENTSLVMFQYDYGIDVSDAYDDLRSALDTASLKLPKDCEKPTIIEMNMNAQPVMMISCVEKGDIDLLNVVNESVVPSLESVTGVAEVSVSGGSEDYIRVLMKPEIMKQYGLTASTLSSIIASADFTYPSGSVDQGSQEISVTTSLEYETVQELRNLPITTATGQTVLLSDVAEITNASKDAASISRYDGDDSISISMTKNQSYGTVNVCRNLLKKLSKIEAENPAISFDVTYDASDSIIRSLISVGETLAIGVVLSMLVLFLFFGDMKASFIVGSSMPVSLLVTFVMMSIAGFSLNLITMGAMVIAIGMMVDSSIVVIESCFRAKEQGYSFHKAALMGTKEVSLSIVASTITTVVVYVPLATMKGLSGQMFNQLGYTIVFAMLASLISAMTLVPLFYTLFKPHEKKELLVSRMLRRFNTRYEPFLHKVLHKKLLVVLATVGIVVLTIFVGQTLNVELMASTDEGIVEVQADFRPGTNLETKDQVLRQLETMAEADEDVEHYTVSIGSSSVFSSASSGSISLTLKDDKSIDTNEKVEEWYLKTKDFTNVDIRVSAGGSSSNSMMTSTSYEVDLQGTNKDIMKSDLIALQAQIRQLPGVTNVTTSAAESSTLAKVVVDPLKSMSYGLTPVSVGVSINNALSGVKAVSITHEGDEYDVYLEYPEGMYDNLNGLMNLDIQTPAGVFVPLRDIATIKYQDALESIERENGKYQSSLTATMLPSQLFETQKAIEEIVSAYHFENGVEPAENTMVEMMNEELGYLLKAILTAVFLVFLVMAIQFESPVHSGMVMLCIPFSLIGSFLFMAAIRATVSMISMMGFLMLMGIVVNNGILFVDSTNQLKQSLKLEDALVKAASTRVRPILMTTLTTILSMVPMGIGFGDNGKMMQSMALVIIGGLIASTVLTLILLPTFYLILNRIGERRRRRKEAAIDDTVMY